MTVRLSRWRPVTWRRVLIPATDSPATLDWVISVLFGWGCDRLHVFRAGRRTFTDPVFPLDEAQDEDDAWLSRLFATGVRTLTYTYDLGAGWEHEIVLDKLVPTPPGQPGARCVAFAGGSPLEYPVLEDRRRAGRRRHPRVGGRPAPRPGDGDVASRGGATGTVRPATLSPVDRQARSADRSPRRDELSVSAERAGIQAAIPTVYHRENAVVHFGYADHQTSPSGH
jgi:hypothetical protein